MAGASSEDDAVSLNVTPLIDIIFCLCIFFMCSFHFRQLEGSLDSWLPKTHGGHEGPVPDPQFEEMRVFFSRDPQGGTKVAFGARVMGVLPSTVAANAERDRILSALEELLVTQHRDYEDAGKVDTPVILDGDPGVPWRDVLAVLDICKKRGLGRVEFAQPWPEGVRH